MLSAKKNVITRERNNGNLTRGAGNIVPHIMSNTSCAYQCTVALQLTIIIEQIEQSKCVQGSHPNRCWVVWETDRYQRYIKEENGVE